MSTNFYWYVPVEDFLLPTGKVVQRMVHGDAMIIHLGKRSAAGLYCWDCGITLCKEGPDKVHSGYHGDGRWYEKCPKCGAEPVDEKLAAGPVAVELGFAVPRPARPTGVRGCSSFIWQQDRDKILNACRTHPDEKIIRDEYDKLYTGQEFLDMVEFNCPINIYQLERYFE